MTPYEKLDAIRAEIEEYKKKHNIPLCEVADHAGMVYSTLHHFVSGKTEMPAPDNLRRIVEVLEMNKGEFFLTRQERSIVRSGQTQSGPKGPAEEDNTSGLETLEKVCRLLTTTTRLLEDYISEQKKHGL